jgi:hypothetical protein
MKSDVRILPPLNDRHRNDGNMRIHDPRQRRFAGAPPPPPQTVSSSNRIKMHYDPYKQKELFRQRECVSVPGPIVNKISIQRKSVKSVPGWNDNREQKTRNILLPVELKREVSQIRENMNQPRQLIRRIGTNRKPINNNEVIIPMDSPLSIFARKKKKIVIRTL